MNTEQENFRPKEAAEFLRIGLSTLWLKIKLGKIKRRKPSAGTTVITREELLAYLQRNDVC